MSTVTRIGTEPTPWEWMLNVSTSAPAAYVPYVPAVADPVFQASADSSGNGWVIKKKDWSLLELAFFTDTSTLGTFSVRVLGLSQLRTGKFVQSPIAEFDCTSAAGLGTLPLIAGGEFPITVDHTAVSTIVQTGGSSSIVVNSTGFGLATVLIDPGAAQFIRLEFQDPATTRKVNGVWRGF